MSKKAVEHLIQVDPKLAKVIREVGPPKIKIDQKEEPYTALIESIVYQQLHGKAAATILERVKNLYPGKKIPEAKRLLSTPDEKLRAAGLSASKLKAIRSVAEHRLSGILPSRKEAHTYSDEELMERLTQIHGVGPWTVQMFLIFTLGRKNIWPVADFGVRKGYQLVHQKREMPTPKQLEKKGGLYAPYCSVAAWYFWRATEVLKTPPRTKSKRG